MSACVEDAAEIVVPDGQFLDIVAIALHRSLLLRRVMAPIHQAVAPVRMLNVLRALRQMAMHIADHLAHVIIVAVGEVGDLLALDGDNLPAAGVPNAFALAFAVLSLPADRNLLLCVPVFYHQR